MLAHDLKMQISQEKLDTVILSYADSNHYLVGGVDHNGNFHALTNHSGKTITFNSLREAEVMLAGLGVDRAVFEMQSAYDEMVSSSSSGSAKITVNVFH